MYIYTRLKGYFPNTFCKEHVTIPEALTTTITEYQSQGQTCGGVCVFEETTEAFIPYETLARVLYYGGVSRRSKTIDSYQNTTVELRAATAQGGVSHRLSHRSKTIDSYQSTTVELRAATAQNKFGIDKSHPSTKYKKRDV